MGMRYMVRTCGTFDSSFVTSAESRISLMSSTAKPTYEVMFMSEVGSIYIYTLIDTELAYGA